MINLPCTENTVLYNLTINIQVGIQYDVWNNIEENIWDDIWDNIGENICVNIGIDSFEYINVSPETLSTIESQIKNQVYE